MDSSFYVSALKSFSFSGRDTDNDFKRCRFSNSKIIVNHTHTSTYLYVSIMYGCESWTVKKAERRRIDAFELWCWRRLLRVP